MSACDCQSFLNLFRKDSTFLQFLNLAPSQTLKCSLLYVTHDEHESFHTFLPLAHRCCDQQYGTFITVVKIESRLLVSSQRAKTKDNFSSPHARGIQSLSDKSGTRQKNSAKHIYIHSHFCMTQNKKQTC